jgi:hypothetical protein
LFGKPEGKRLLGTPRSRYEDNIKTDLREIRWSNIYWIDLVHNRYQWRALVTMVVNLCVPENVKFLSS